MAIDPQEVRRIAELARLAIPEDSVARVAGQLSGVLEFVATLDSMDLAGCEPSVFAPASSALRPDEPDGRTLAPETAVAAAPETEYDFFLVPPVLENLEP